MLDKQIYIQFSAVRAAQRRRIASWLSAVIYTIELDLLDFRSLIRVWSYGNLRGIDAG
jgi:hypothetical protein